MRYLYLILLVTTFFTACRSTRPIQTVIRPRDTAAVAVTPPAADNRRQDSLRYIRSLMAGLDSNRIRFSTFSAKVNVDYSTSDGKKYDINAIVRMQRDSAIWISANALLGIEALRVLVTRDSVKVLDKLNKTYTARSVDYLQEVTALPLNLSTLQDLIAGNPVFLDSSATSYTASGDGTVTLLALGRFFRHLITVSAADRLPLRSKLDDVDPIRVRTAELIYEDYGNESGRRFSRKRSITVSEKKRLDIRLDFKGVEFDGAVSFPFTVPRNYGGN